VSERQPAVSSDDQGIYWIGLGRIDGLGGRGALSLVKRFGSPSAVYGASVAELEACGVPVRVAKAICTQAGLSAAERELEMAQKAECHVLPLGADGYPPILRQIADPPLVLYVRGDTAILSRYAIAIVGTRRPTAYGSSVAVRLARDLAQRQLVVVSGMARGIDSAAHRGALEAAGKTVAVLGSGIDVIYPRENKRLADLIAASGAVISEFPVGTHPAPENFPIRNRVISGLCLGTLIVEAAEYSGSLITARMALEQNREVFAVPGNITSPQSFGPNLLIKQGAKLVDQWLDIVEEFPAEIRMQLLPPAPASEGTSGGIAGPMLPLTPELNGDEKKVYETLRTDEALYVDSICGTVALPQSRVLTVLLQLEMSGLVKQLPGMNFVRKL
jgi:DNA processing protein